MFRHRLLLVAGLGLAACSGGGTSTPTPLPTDTVTSSTAAVATTPGSTAAGATTTAPSTSSAPTSSVAAGVALSPDGPWRLVDSAPGVTTPGLVYELMPKLWVYLPTEEDIPRGITWTLNETDRPVIEAYLQARLVFFRVTETNPFDLGDPGWTQWYTDGGVSYRAILTERSARGEVFDRDAGVVLRPVVLGEARSESEAIVFDCMLDGGVWRLPDGTLGPDSTPGVSPSGVSARVLDSASGWKITGLARQPEACQ